METSGGIQASLAGRYASALFGLARDERQIEAVGKSLDLLSQALVDSREFISAIVADPDPKCCGMSARKTQASLPVSAPQSGNN